MSVLTDADRLLAGHRALSLVACRDVTPASALAVAALDAARVRLQGQRVEAAQLSLDALVETSS